MKISVSTLGMYPAKMENILEFVDKNRLKYLEIITEYPYKHVTSDDLSNYDFDKYFLFHLGKLNLYHSLFLK